MAKAEPVAIVEKLETSFEVEGSNKMVIRELVRIKILSEAGYRYGLYGEYYNSFRKIRNLKCTVFDAAGNRVKRIGKGDAVDIMLNPNYEVGDARLMIIDPEYKLYPFTVEYESEIQYNGFIDFPVWMPRFAPQVSVKQASLTLKCGKNFGFRHRELGGLGAPKSDVIDEVAVYSWTVEDLPAQENVVSHKLFTIEQPRVHITPIEFELSGHKGTFESWEKFGVWYLQLNSGRNKLTDETMQFLDGLRQLKLSTHQMVDSAYRYMQNRTRYVSIQLGIGGYQSIPSDEVEKTSYGDCKALSNYMKAMMDYLRIPSNFVLVKAGRDMPDILHDFPSNQFNHVFLAVPLPTDTVWLECTSQVIPPSFVGTFTDDRHALWLDWSASKVIRTPVYEAEDNIKQSEAKIKLNNTGDAELNLTIRQSGVFYDEVLAYKYMLTDQQKKFNYSKFDYKDFTIKSFKFSIPDKDYPALDLDYGIHVKGAAKKIGSKLAFQSNLLTPIDKNVELDPVNKKCEIRRGFTLVDEVDIEIPEGFWVDFLPEEKSEKSIFGSMEIKIRSDDGRTIHISRTVRIKKGLYTNDDFDQFNIFLKRIRSADQGRVVLNSKT